eukprot:1739702-Amphidinium_carterae.4
MAIPSQFNGDQEKWAEWSFTIRAFTFALDARLPEYVDGRCGSITQHRPHTGGRPRQAVEYPVVLCPSDVGEGSGFDQTEGGPRGIVDHGSHHKHVELLRFPLG